MIFTGNFIPFCEDISAIQKDSVISIFGYPGKAFSLANNDGKRLITHQMGFKQEGGICNFFPTTMYHRVPTETGQSGAPIIIHQNKELSILGIHKGGTSFRN